MMVSCMLQLPWRVSKRRSERDQAPAPETSLQLGPSQGDDEEKHDATGLDRVTSDPPPEEALSVECLLSKKRKAAADQRPRFRDHVWTYKQMYRAEETSMAFNGNNNNKKVVAETGFGEGGEDEGLELLRTLFACAEAVACRDARQASALIERLRLAASPYGSSLQRVGTCFAEGLAARLSQAPGGPGGGGGAASERERREAQRLMVESCPYVPFGHFAANSAILEAFEGEESVHVVDLGGAASAGAPLLLQQWRPLVAALAERGIRRVRLTAVAVGAGPCAAGLEPGTSSSLSEGGLEFEFRAVAVESLESLAPGMLDLRAGEALAVNSVLQLHRVVKESRGSLNAVLRTIRGMAPRVLTLVEQDASHNGPFFLGRFMEALYYYSAVFDSVDAVMPKSSTQRVKIEQHYFKEEIKNIVSCEGAARVERHERVDQWRRRMSRAGFQPCPLKLLVEAEAWLRRNHPCDGYTLAEEKGCLVLGWRGKPVVAASCWKL